METENKLEDKLYCQICKVKTNHRYIKRYVENGNEIDGYPFGWSDEYYITQCLGCDNIAFFRKYGDEDMIDYDRCGERYYYHNKYVYPEEPKPTILLNETVSEYEKMDLKAAPEVIQELYEQVVSCFELQHYLLAAVGLRMIIEGFCNDQQIEEGIKYTNAGNKKKDEGGNIKRFNDLEGRINGMEENKLITPVNRDVLHQIRHLGNATAHELEVPKRSTILEAIKIIENLITNVYVYKQTDILNN